MKNHSLTSAHWRRSSLVGLAIGLALTANAGSALAETLAEPAAATTTVIDHQPFDQLLQKAVVKDRVDYAVFRDSEPFKAYLDQLAKVNPEALPDRASRLAFWINAYNALTIAAVVKAGPGLNSVTEAGPDFAFFKVAKHAVGGRQLSLDEIENKIIRPTFREPRVHAALNCASISCPPLQGQAFVPKRLEAQLAGAMHAFINDPARNQIGADGVRLSKIFEWYAADFEASGGVRGWLDRELEPARKAHLPPAGVFEFLPYDWRLNRL